MRRPLHLIALPLLVGAALVVAACGSDNKTSSEATSAPTSAASTPTAAATTPAAKKIKVGLVTDIGGLNDRSFNQLANAGLMQSEKDLGVEGRVLPSSKPADYIPNLSTLAQQGDDLVIGVGFLMADAIDTVATKFPNVKFAIIDVDATTLKHKPTNVTGLLFKEQEAGYLAGYMAGLYAKDNSATTISSVGGVKIPPVDHYIAGYQAGAKAADPSIKTLNNYSQDFVDQGKCKELALQQIQQGSKVVFQVAGQCGLGAIDAAKEKGVQAVGVDADQAYLGSQILTSAEKKVDVAVETAIKAAGDGSLAGGTNSTFDIKNGGVGIGKTNAEGAKYADQVKAIQDKIASGELTGIPSTVPGK